MTQSSENIVSVAPTKRFFISVLVKDIYLIDAIVELVDNSVDAARTRFGKEELRNVVVAIEFDREKFRIHDNAGGIPIEQARSYAFRFGRASNAPATPGTVGEFGVGMKRALFKLGNKFDIQSKTQDEYFKIFVNVPEWERADEKDPNSWSFNFSEQGKHTNKDDVGTEIVVTDLFDSVVSEFSNTSFGTKLTNLLQEAHSESLALGLQIIVNNHPVHGVPPELLESEDLQPIRNEIPLKILDKDVNCTIIAGVGSPNLAEAGWYVFCNGRQIERAEKSEKTGWNSAIDGESTPKAHWQYRRFRGYVFFESKYADVLPWNTTKTSLNIESPTYLSVYQDMQAALRQVISFLNALDGEGSDGGVLTEVVETAKRKPITQVQANQAFKYTATATPVSRPKEARISYLKPAEVVDTIKQHAGLRNNKEVGEYTFQYFLDNEGLNG